MRILIVHHTERMNQVAPEPSAPAAPISETRVVSIPTDDQSTSRGGVSTPESAPGTAWPNEAPPPYCELPGEQDEFPEYSMEPPPPYDCADPPANGCHGLRAQPDTAINCANAANSSHRANRGSEMSTGCLVVCCIFCPFIFIIGSIVFVSSIIINKCIEDCCESNTCTRYCQHDLTRFCP